MKKIIFTLSIALGAMVFYSCGREEALTPNPTFDETANGENPNGTGTDTTGTDTTGGNGTGGGTGGGALSVGSVPTSFTKKVVLEENTGEWCGWCPYGARIMEENIAANPGRVIGIGVHDGDPMEVSAYNSWQKSTTGVSGFPSGSIDRADASNRGTWTSTITSNLASTAVLGLAMEASETNGMLTLDVYVGYTDTITPGETKLTVAIIENDVPQSSGRGQVVYDTGNPSTTMDPLPAGWLHGHVLRGIVTRNAAGDDVALNSTDQYTKISFTNIDLSTYSIADMANVHIAAFVHTNTSPRVVFNAQEAGLNELKAWD